MTSLGAREEGDGYASAPRAAREGVVEPDLAVAAEERNEDGDPAAVPPRDAPSTPGGVAVVWGRGRRHGDIADGLLPVPGCAPANSRGAMGGTFFSVFPSVAANRTCNAGRLPLAESPRSFNAERTALTDMRSTSGPWSPSSMGSVMAAFPDSGS